MSTLLSSRNGQYFNFISSNGSSVEHYEIVKKVREVQIHRLESVAWKYNASFYLFSSKDISEFEDRIEEIRDELIEGHAVLSKEDLKIIRDCITKLDSFFLQAIARLLAPLLENKFYSQNAASMIRILLAHSEAEVRYAALEAIAYALGEVQIADELLAEAKNLLENEKSIFVCEYLESL